MPPIVSHHPNAWTRGRIRVACRQHATRDPSPVPPHRATAVRLTAPRTSSAGVLVRRRPGGTDGDRFRHAGRARNESVRGVPGTTPVGCLHRLSRRVRRVLPADAPRLPGRTGQRHSAGDRRAAHDRPSRHQPRPVAPHRSRQSHTHLVRPVMRRVDRPRGANGADRRYDHARARRHRAPPTPGTRARVGAGRRCRRDRSGVQYTAGGRGVCHRGTQPLLRIPHVRRRSHRSDHRRRNDTGADGRLFVFRPHDRRAGASAWAGSP